MGHRTLEVGIAGVEVERVGCILQSQQRGHVGRIVIDGIV